MTEEQFEALRKWIASVETYAGLAASQHAAYPGSLTQARKWVHEAELAARAALVTETK